MANTIPATTIDTGVKGNRGNLALEVNFDTLTANGNLFGAYNARTDYINGWGLYDQGMSNNFYIHYNSNFRVTNAGSKGGIIKMDRNKLYVDGVLVHTQDTEDTFDVPHNIWLLGGNFGDTGYSPDVPVLNLKEAKVWLKDILVRHFVPCVLLKNITADKDSKGTARNAGAVGMWDILTDKFYANSGTGAFTYG